jgi:hypothetical protein
MTRFYFNMFLRFCTVSSVASKDTNGLNTHLTTAFGARGGRAGGGGATTLCGWSSDSKAAKTSLKEGRPFGSPDLDVIVAGSSGDGAVNGDDTPRSTGLGLKPKSAGDLDGE